MVVSSEVVNWLCSAVRTLQKRVAELERARETPRVISLFGALEFRVVAPRYIKYGSELRQGVCVQKIYAPRYFRYLDSTSEGSSAAVFDDMEEEEEAAFASCGLAHSGFSAGSTIYLFDAICGKEEHEMSGSRTEDPYASLAKSSPRQNVGAPVSSAAVGMHVPTADVGMQVSSTDVGMQVSGSASADVAMQVSSADVGTQVSSADVGMHVSSADVGRHVSGSASTGVGMQVSSADVGLQVSSAEQDVGMHVSSAEVEMHVSGSASTGVGMQVSSADVGLQVSSAEQDVGMHVSSAEVEMHVSGSASTGVGMQVSSADVGLQVSSAEQDAEVGMRVSSAGSATTCARVNRSEVRVPDKMEQFDQFVIEVGVHGRSYLIDDMLRMSFTSQNVFRLARCLGRKFGTPVASKTQCRKLGYGYSLNHDILFGVFYMCTRLKISEIHGFTRQRATRDTVVEGILQDLIVVQGGPRTLGEHVHASFWKEDFSQWTLQDTRRVLGSVGTGVSSADVGMRVSFADV